MLSGSIVALVTPMDEEGRIDSGAFCRLLDFHLENGTSAVVIAGTTGESPVLDKDEFKALLGAAVAQIDGAIPVVAGTGSASTQKTVELTRIAGDIGADAALVVTPYYNRPTQAGLKAHFETVADASQIPVYLYNVPARTGVDLKADTTVALSQHDGIAGIKEAVADMDRVRDLLQRCREGFSIISGDDGSCCQAMLYGARGVISVAANVTPGPFSKMCKLAVSRDEEGALKADAELRELYGLLGIEPNPVPVKWMLHRMGLIGPGIRLPLVPLDRAHHAAVNACLEQLRLI